MVKSVQAKVDFIVFFIFIFLAFWMYQLSHSNLLAYSFKPIEVFFHEASHGLMTLLTGNHIAGLHLGWREGHVISSVRPRHNVAQFFITFCGYPGASFFGFLIYATSLFSTKIIKSILILFTAFFFIYADSIMTMGILSFVLGIFILCWFLNGIGTYLLRFLGIFVMMNAIYSPTYLWSYNYSGDHVSLSKLTGLPSFLFILIWIMIGLATLWYAYKLTRIRSTNELFEEE